MKYSLSSNCYSVDFEIGQQSAYISNGRFFDIEITRSPIFSATLERISDKQEFVIDSFGNFECVTHNDECTVFINPEGFGEITFIIEHKNDANGISWHTEIRNSSEEYSVISVNYPVPVVKAPSFNMFFPSCSGRVIKDVGNVGFKIKDTYPHHYSSMQYFAYYGNTGGIYLGIHDEDACMKYFEVNAEDGKSDLTVLFHAIGAGKPKNCFSLGGYIRWEAFSGDWFDATAIYREFVQNHAKWLPEITLEGRPDTPYKFKEIPYWIVEYMPNTPEQRDVRPKKLGAVSHLYSKDYWFEAPIALQKRLGTPIGYHIYNWHNNPFNINYPHFTPKDEYFRGLSQLKGKNINVVPYINAVAWEVNDADEGWEMNFENTGIHGAAIDKFGNPFTIAYPQKKITGEDTVLAAMCPSFPKWREIVNGLARKLENELDVDGIYFDEIAAHTPHPCRSDKHDHICGGGSYWVEGYNELMEIVKQNKKDGVFYVSESSGEPYMKSFDGYLTWLWRQPDDVPAFSQVYAGYIVMFGRFSDGLDNKDDVIFRNNIAKGLLYGQQMGWLFADVVYNEERMSFLEKYVQMRYKHTRTFICSDMLRPPKNKANDEFLFTAGWKMRDNSSVTIFVANTENVKKEFSVTFDNREYGIDTEKLPENSKVNGDFVTLSGSILPYECVDITLCTKKL